jgi:hypothetical protein
LNTLSGAVPEVYKSELTSKKVLHLGNVFARKGSKLASVSTVALTVAACDLDTDTAPTTTVDTGDTSPTVSDPNAVMGATIDGAFYDGASVDTVEFTGNTDPDVDAGEWINISQIVIRDANGDFTITDLQATDTDAATGAPGTTFVLDDTSQNALGTTTLNFDIQAVDEDDTSVTISMNEAAGRLVLNGGDIETLNIVIDDISPADVTVLTSLDVQGIGTLTISGGEFGYVFTIQDPLNETISTLDASEARSFLNLNITNALSSTYLLGFGDDRLIMGNTLGSNDIISGGDGRDTITVLFETGGIVAPQISDLEVLDAVFVAEATFSGANVPGLQEINLGLDGDGVKTAGSADIDLDNIHSDLTTLNIHASQQDIEADYQNGAQANLSINFDLGAAATVGDGIATDIELHDVRSLSVTNQSDHEATILDSIDLNSDTSALTLNTFNAAGALRLTATDAAFSNGSELSQISVSAVNGDIVLGSGGGDFVDEVLSLQNYSVLADDAQADIGGLGSRDAAIELETVTITLLNESAVKHGAILAHDGTNKPDLSELRIVASDQNILSGNTASGNVSVYLEGLYAGEVAAQIIDVSDGGHVELDDQMYMVDYQVFQGSGDITIAGGDTVVASTTGYIQLSTADASAHSGDRTFIASATNEDIFYGSDKDDIVLLSFSGTKTYNDAGGSDTVTLSGTGNRFINDGAVGTDDIYTFAGAGTGFVFNAGSGFDTVTFTSGSNLADFGSYISGVVQIDSFTSGSDTLSFDGLPNITASTTNPMIAAGGSVASINSNTTYVFADGDVAVSAFAVANYENLSDVADFLDAATQTSAGVGDAAVFVINNVSVTPNVSGDDQDAYVYLYNDDGSGGGIQASELTLVASIDTSGAGITPADIT